MSNDETSIGVNSHIRDYINFYMSLKHPPGFAVLLDGPWGIGKTHFVKKMLTEDFTNEEDWVYVSLYGLSSVAEIDTALFHAAYPVSGAKGTRLGIRAVTTALKYFNLDPELKMSDVLSRPVAKLYVFDDLERCSLPIEETLGYINTFVEHDELKVLLIANEIEIRGKREYQIRREKLVGKVLRLESSFDEALSYFLTLLDSSAAIKFLESSRPEIAAIYSQSGLNNLRILQQTLQDFSRLFDLLSEKQQECASALLILFELFSALSFELKSGRVEEAHLKSRVDNIVAGLIAQDTDTLVHPLAVANDRYPQIDLGHSILSNDILIETLVRGRFDQSRIRNFLDMQTYFNSDAEHVPWRVVWHGLEENSDRFYEALQSMEDQFESREFRDVGEILHVFGIRIWLSRIGILEKSVKEVVKECRNYVEFLFVENLLTPKSPGGSTDYRIDGNGGLGVMGKENEEYRDLYELVEKKRKTAYQKQLPSLAGDLVKEMKLDSSLFFRRLNSTNSEENIYFNIPVMAFVGVSEFVECVLQLEPVDRRTVIRSFEKRYDLNWQDSDRKLELEWLLKVANLILKRADELSGIEKYQIQMYVRWYLKSVLPEIDAGMTTS